MPRRPARPAVRLAQTSGQSSGQSSGRFHTQPGRTGSGPPHVASHHVEHMPPVAPAQSLHKQSLQNETSNCACASTARSCCDAMPSRDQRRGYQAPACGQRARGTADLADRRLQMHKCIFLLQRANRPLKRFVQCSVSGYLGRAHGPISQRNFPAISLPLVFFCAVLPPGEAAGMAGYSR